MLGFFPTSGGPPGAFAEWSAADDASAKSIRFGTQSGGLSGVLFAAQDAFVGISGTFAATLNPVVMAASGSIAQVFVEIFDVTVNISPNYLDSYYEGTIGTFAATLNPVVMVANEGIVINGVFNATLIGVQMAAVGAHILPVTGVFAATLNPIIMSAGASPIGIGSSSVTMRSLFSGSVTSRQSSESDVVLH